MLVRVIYTLLLLPTFSFGKTPIKKLHSSFSLMSASDRLRRAALIRSLWGHPTELEQAAENSIGVSHNAELESKKIGRLAAAVKNSNLTLSSAFIAYPKGKPRKDPCKAGASDTKPTPYELKTQGNDIADGDELRKYTTPCKPPPFLLVDKLQAPGLPIIPVAPPIDMPPPYNPSQSEENPGWRGGDSIYGNADSLAYAAAVNALKRL